MWITRQGTSGNRTWCVRVRSPGVCTGGSAAVGGEPPALLVGCRRRPDRRPPATSRAPRWRGPRATATVSVEQRLCARRAHLQVEIITQSK